MPDTAARLSLAKGCWQVLSLVMFKQHIFNRVALRLSDDISVILNRYFWAEKVVNGGSSHLDNSRHTWLYLSRYACQ